MPKTFHFKTTFDVKLVLQDKDLEHVEGLLSEIDASSVPDALIDQKRTGMGKSLDERIALMARATIRNAVVELMAEEFPEGYSFSPAKVTQVTPFVPHPYIPVETRPESESWCASCKELKGAGGRCTH